MKDPSILVHMAEDLLSTDHQLAKEVRLSFKRPEKYLTKFEEDLLQRGIVNPVPELPWIALVDGLMRRGQLVELDWKASSTQILATIMELLEERHAPQELIDELSNLPLEDGPSYEILEQLGKKTKAHGYDLVEFDINSDSHPLSVISKNTPQFVELAELAGYGRLVVYN